MEVPATQAVSSKTSLTGVEGHSEMGRGSRSCGTFHLPLLFRLSRLLFNEGLQLSPGKVHVAMLPSSCPDMFPTQCLLQVSNLRPTAGNGPRVLQDCGYSVHLRNLRRGVLAK